jgi:hypothetical protein
MTDLTDRTNFEPFDTQTLSSRRLMAWLFQDAERDPRPGPRRRRNNPRFAPRTVPASGGLWWKT